MADSFTLVIDIRGLCLFVPHEGAMHVLLPDERAAHGQQQQQEQHEHEHRAMPAHVARFGFSTDHNVPGNGDPERDEVPFHNARWDLHGIVAGVATLSLPDAVQEVAQFAGLKGLKRHQLKKREQLNVKSHLVLSAGAAECRGKVASFRIRQQGQDKVVRMTNMVRWVIPNVPGTQLDWQFEDLDGTPRTPLAPLRPDKNGIIKLDLLHAPENEPDEDVCPPPNGNHFHGYYALFSGHGPQPTCIEGSDQPAECPEDGWMGLLPKFRAPSVFTCMTGRTEVDLET